MKISFYCGDSLETWSPRSVKQGIGGSEEAVINMAMELAKLGNEVTVWNNCGDDADTYGQVVYKDYLDFVDEPVDVLVSWRTEGNLKYAKNFKVAYHWLHDTVEENRVLAAFRLGARKIMVLSEFHRRLYPKIRNEEIFLTQNGVNFSLFEGKKVARVPGRVFYGSSYDRGLKELLEEWPKIKLAVPEATLRIAYGWQTWEAIAKAQDGLDNFKRVKESMEQLMEQDGITHLGRVSHDQIANEMMEADVWAYPTWWPEISCITAMKAQLGGAIPVVIPTAAVAETVGHYGHKTDRGYYMDIEGNPAVRAAETLDQWVKMMVDVLTMDPKTKEIERGGMIEWAKKRFNWQTVAKEWQKEFKSEAKKVVIEDTLEKKGYAHAM